ncbi:acyltransferase family protein [Chryseobacterium sp.]|uniref:acyltransferase family protein n=1 Tax=Chryseobacterium sp. TaxID=1871047 RepID=UPI002FCC04F5
MKSHINTINNFDFLRLLFASLVIIHHAFPLSGRLPNDPTFFWSNEQLSIGTLSVGSFFAISGYLILGSLNRSKGLIDYFWKRIIRLYPGLIVMMAVTCLVIITIDYSMIYSKSFYTYFSNRIILYGSQFSIVNFFDDNPYPGVINGSLWTLSYEFTCYAMIFLLYFFRNNLRMQKLITFTLFAVFYSAYNLKISLHFLSRLNLDSSKFFEFGIFFISGMIMYYYKKNIKKATYLVVFIVLILSVYFDIFRFAFPLIALVVISFGRESTKYINLIGSKIGDLSYGIYIYGFLIQQTLMHYYNLNWVVLTIVSFIITFFMAYLSWKFVEKPVLKFKILLTKNN